jgi:hypothetical protein
VRRASTALTIGACASHPPSRSFGVAGSEAATALMGVAVVLAERAVLA